MSNRFHPTHGGSTSMTRVRFRNSESTLKEVCTPLLNHKILFFCLATRRIPPIGLGHVSVALYIPLSGNKVLTLLELQVHIVHHAIVIQKPVYTVYAYIAQHRGDYSHFWISNCSDVKQTVSTRSQALTKLLFNWTNAFFF